MAVYANRRRIRGARGKRLQRRRGERIERPFAHLYETGAMRRTHLRGHTNILKRLLVHTAALNLGLMLRTMFGRGTQRGLQGCMRAFFAFLRAVVAHLWTLTAPPDLPTLVSLAPVAQALPERSLAGGGVKTGFTTGCYFRP
jgi:hypothetical protein